VINDRLDVALSVEGAGVHLRSDSLSLPVAFRQRGGASRSRRSRLRGLRSDL
jgi:thiamine monophosphate synthase